MTKIVCTVQQEDEETKTEELEFDIEKQETEEMRQAQAYLEAAGGQTDPMAAYSIGKKFKILSQL